jgi:hypothetical protein
MLRLIRGVTNELVKHSVGVPFKAITNRRCLILRFCGKLQASV